MANTAKSSPIEVELRRAAAENLGRTGELLEQSIARYQALHIELGGVMDEPARKRLAAARTEVLKLREWLIIQREAIGLRRHGVVDEMYPLAHRLLNGRTA